MVRMFSGGYWNEQTTSGFSPWHLLDDARHVLDAGRDRGVAQDLDARGGEEDLALRLVLDAVQVVEVA